MAPNEARATVGLPPVVGGDTPYLQQQNFGLFALARRDEEAAKDGASNAATKTMHLQLAQLEAPSMRTPH